MKLQKKASICAILICSMLTASVTGVSAAGRAVSGNSTTDTNADTSAQTEILNETQQIESDEDAGISTYSLPANSYRMNVNINGRDVLQGQVFGIGSTTYVPMFKFCDWLGVFSYSYDRMRGVATVSGKGLEISASEGALYIVANGRYFYTVDEILEINGVIYVPIRPLTKALNSKIEWSNTDNEFKVYSGDTSRLKTAAQVYNNDEIYWLSRIINAEAGGESLQGKIAVGNVILNRVRSSQFPNTIYSVIFDRKFGVQFSPTANGAIYKTPNTESIIAAKMCIEGYSLSTEVLYFFNPKTSPTNWISQNRQFAFRVQNHVFYY